MQLHLTIEEFELLKRLAEDERRLSCDAMPSFAQLSSEPRLQYESEIGRDLICKELSRNLQLGFDELEDLANTLTWRKNQLVKEISCTAEPTAKSELENRLSILDQRTHFSGQHLLNESGKHAYTSVMIF